MILIAGMSQDLVPLIFALLTGLVCCLIALAGAYWTVEQAYHWHQCQTSSSLRTHT